MEQTVLDGLQNLQLTKEEEDSIQISAHNNVNLLEECHLSLFGKLLSNRKQNQRALKSTLRSVWRMGPDLRIMEVGNDILQFKFSSKHQLECVERNGPWNFDNNLLLLCRWRRGLVATNITFSHSLFWVQVWGVPFELMTEITGRDIGNTMGKFVEMDKRSWQMEQAKFMRLRVELPIDRPLRRGGYLRNMEGEKTWVTFKYERLLNICFACGRIGHDVRHCEVAIESQPKEHQYGGWIRANGSYKGLSEKMKAEKRASNLSNDDGEGIESPPPRTVTENLETDNGAVGKKSDGDRWGGSDSWGALDDTDGSESQRASTPMRWDNSEERLPTTKEKETTFEFQKSLHLVSARDKDKMGDGENSLVGLAKGKMIEEPDVTSPRKPKLGASAEEELGYLDMGQNKEKQPEEVRKWKKLARVQGPTEDAVMKGQETSVGGKRERRAEKREVDGERKAKRICERGVTNDAAASKETAVAAEQHHREQ
ncbi:hypothetical protein SO802_006268 [Lithocarpus litseifolius]|uniref:CCHC-type domain-containing protein n=1 Tax=Lithocarpus litseifolius TaxID=425828 RepID=A0AAW2DKF0_9ROSI